MLNNFSRLVNFVSAAILAIMISLSVEAMASTEEDLRSAIAQLKADDQRVRDFIKRQGTPEAKLAVSRIGFIAEDSIFSNPRIGVMPGRSGVHIVLQNQTRLMLSYFSEVAIALGERPSLKQCAISYSDHIRMVMAGNRLRLMKGEDLEDVQSPEAFSASRSICKELLEYFPFPQRLRPQRNHMVEISIAFIYFHELGHAVRNHRPINQALLNKGRTEEERRRIFISEMARSRGQEEEADRWATNELIAMGFAPEFVVTVPLVQLLVAAGGIDCYFESLDSHGTGLNRFSAISDQAKRSFKARYGIMPNPGLVDVLDDVVALAEKTKSTLSCSHMDSN